MIQNVELDLPREVLQRIDALAAKLGTTVDLLWPELVKYEYGTAVGGLAVSAAWTLLALACVAACVIILVRESRKDDLEMNLALVFLPIAFFLCSLAVLINVSDDIPNYFGTTCAPAGAALRSLMGR